jgi:hemoglobin/transferrin/lactoferrin receptor protein
MNVSTTTIITGIFVAQTLIADTTTVNNVVSENITPSEIVVTATRDKQQEINTPYSTSIISAKTMRIEKPARTVPETLKNEPGVMIQKTGHGQGSPYIRGFTGYRNLFLIDGIRLNNSIFRDGPNQYWNTVDALSLNKIELVRGPSSVLYGSDAIGGTVNAITRGAQNLSPDNDWDINLYYRYASAENSHIARAETIGRLTEKLTMTLGYSYKDFGDVKGGRNVGTQKHTGYTEKDWDAKLEYFITDNAYLVLANQNVNIDNAWRTHKTIYGIDWKGLSVGKELYRILDQDRNLTYLQYHQYNMNGFAEELHAGISRHHQAEDRNRLRTENRHDVEGINVDTYGAFVSLKSPSDIGTFIYGADFYHDNVDSYKHKLDRTGKVKSTSIQGPVGDDASYDLLGTYLQDEINATRQLLFIIGGRYEFAKANADSVQDPISNNKMNVSDDWSSLQGSIRAIYSLNAKKDCNIFAGISQGYRAPNLSDLTRFDSARTDEIETPSPNLDPEQFISYETGIKISHTAVFAQLSLFYTDIDGMIVRTPTGRIIDDEHEITKKNGGNGYVKGIEFNGSYNFAHYFTMFGTFTWMDGKVDTYPTSSAVLVSEPIDRLMPPTGNIGLRWSTTDKKYWIEGACTIAATADKLSTRDKADTSRIPAGGTPGYTVYDIRTGCNINKNMSLSLAVENITDEDYRIHGSGINEPGRNIVVAIESKF